MAKKAAQSAKIHIGTSGWMYKDWGAMFYPTGMKKGFLSYLAREFSTVEINSSFYHLPLASTFAKWHGEVPEGFVFAVKLSRFITHRKKLAGVREPLRTFFSRAAPLREKLGPILIQLPPFLKYDEHLFTSFMQSLDATSKGKRLCFALEPRHVSWFEEAHADAIRERLKRSNVALVFPRSRKIPSPDPDDMRNITSDFVYVRFHGPSEFAASRYGPQRLKPWAKRIEHWHSQGLDVFVYFNNDIHGHAVVDARTLKRQLKNRS